MIFIIGYEKGNFTLIGHSHGYIADKEEARMNKTSLVIFFPKCKKNMLEINVHLTM
jgi:hypothetical protein